MTYVITDKQNYEDIADAIRAKNGSQSTYTPSQMATAISNISGSKIPIISANNLFNNGSN